jgi:hypothetical protein
MHFLAIRLQNASASGKGRIGLESDPARRSGEMTLENQNDLTLQHDEYIHSHAEHVCQKFIKL